MTIAEMKAVKDSDIDFSDIPEADANFWASAKLRMPDRPKTATNVRYDSDMLEWFKAQGKGYQSRMNAVLRSFYEAHTSQTKR
ncbi:hypothetical protein ABENE_21280 [Asticcacaulis benevestitus DSM 16100 = ATCC BAA-896]|uniref:3-oxoacyl-ACP synthase n=2 Tax=Asticcacaulis TaxID=76890 RepID=V4P1G9_9CAUL|nr:hypothetical protein ABENE_21280 [Asticcacaulis benevestitus DSM 16100 = ATCC BAA-896]